MSTRREIYTLDEQAHGDLCEALDALPKGAKSHAVREGLALYFAGAGPALERLELENEALRAEVAQLRGQLDAQEQASTARDVETLRAAIDALRGELLDAIATAAMANGHNTPGNPGLEDPELAARLDAQLDDFFNE